MQRVSTYNDYNERVNKVLLYINTHLGEKLDLETLAGISNFSAYHFHRIMKAHINQSLGNYILRVRMDTAANLLCYTDTPVQDIAFKVGYENLSSFSRAFKKRFMISPNEFRANATPAKINSFNEPKPVHLTFELEPKIKQIPGRRIIYANGVGEYGSKITSATWKKIIQFASKYKLFGRNTEFLGVSYDNPMITDGDKCRYDACITVKKDVKPEGEIGVREIPGGKFAIFRFKGPYENFNYVYTRIYRDWLPSSGFILRDENVYEKYINDPGKSKPAKLVTEIHLPVE